MGIVNPTTLLKWIEKIMPVTVSKARYIAYSSGAVKGDMTEMITNYTITLILIAVLLLPVGYKIFKAINKTDIGVTANSTEETMIDVIGTFILVGIVLAIVSQLKKKE